jgi:protein TonB
LKRIVARYAVLLAAGLISVAAHIGFYRWGSAHETPARRAEVVSIAVQWVDKPKPKLDPAPLARTEPAPPPKRPPLVRRLRSFANALEARLKSAPTPAPVETTRPEPPAPPAPPPIGVTLVSTVKESAVAVPVGESLQGALPRSDSLPAGAASGRPGNFVPFSQLSTPPVLLEQVEVYPDAAREAGFAGEVVMRVVLDEEGRVASADKVSGPGHGLDEAALRAIKQFRFRPATYRGAPVCTEIRYVYAFHLH